MLRLLESVVLVSLTLTPILTAWQVIPGTNVQRDDCKARNGKRTCCSGINFGNSSQNINHGTVRDNQCKVDRIYEPSPLEKHHIKVASEAGGNGRAHIAALLNADDERVATRLWMKRIKERMTSINDLEMNDVDLQYLSRFQVTRSCSDGTYDSWFEWIEPLTVHSRNPYAFYHLALAKNDIIVANQDKSVHVQNADYILVQSGEAIARMHGGPPRATFLLDAGCSEGFHLSTQWFACAYAQRGILHDQIYAFEYNKTDPQVFWETVPSNWKSHLLYRNVPINATVGHDDNPLTIIKERARPDDFVAFKLDVDTSDVEMPIAAAILENPEFTSLIDEFFFELHYRCDFMHVHWERKVNITKSRKIPELNGIKLNRIGALEYFSSLRHKGMRAHFWP